MRDAELGLGRVVMNGECLSFFDVPAQPETVLNAGNRSFRQVGLAAQTRVWWRDGDAWLVGRIDSPSSYSAEAYFVHFPNGRTDEVPLADLRFRWNRPLRDPLALLRTGTVETRFLFDRRNDLALRIASQRSACLGLTGLLASAVELHEHQIGAARRVLTDPVPRYLLADEVGLGKTIEAGMVVRQLLTEMGGAVLVLAPDHLVPQWTEELRTKFSIDYLPGSVEVHGHSEMHSLAPRPLTALVVDEAHRFTEGNSAFGTTTSYLQLQSLALQAHCLLLLSATPVRSNEDAFLGLLHLLDPDTYRLDDVEGFRARVAKRDDIAKAISALGNQTPVRYLGQPLQELSALMPEDSKVCASTELALRHLAAGETDSARAEVSRLRLHVSEKYRLHRRMVRTRREAALGMQFPVRGREISETSHIHDPDRRRWDVLASLEAFRVALSDTPTVEGSRALQTIMGRCSAPIDALGDLANALRKQPDHDLSHDEWASITCVAGQDVGIRLARELDAITRMHVDEDRVSAIVDWCRLRVARGKWAIACSFPATATRIVEALIQEFGRHRVTSLLETQSAEERAAGIRECRERSEKTLIVMDRSAEEGANLQFVDAVLHVNLPSITSQLEQRLGRFDRWSEFGRPVVSHSFVDFDPVLNTELRAWERVQLDTFDVFLSSTSIMQYIIADAETRFFNCALHDTFSEAAAQQHAEKENYQEERRKVLAQDLLDSVEDREDDSSLVERLTLVDRDAKEFQSSVYRYVHEMLQFSARFEDDRVLFGVDKRHPPLVPESDIASIGIRAMKRWYTTDRLVAGEGLGFLRSGDPLIDGFERLLKHDDRGRAFLVEICLQTRDPGRAPIVAFRFDFRIRVPEPGSNLDGGETRASHTRAIQHCPDIIERIWLLPGRGECSPELLRVLQGPESAATNLGSRPDRFRQLSAGLDWNAMCQEAFEEAFQAISNRKRVRRHVKAALRASDEAAQREIGVLIARDEPTEVLDQAHRIAGHSRNAISSASPVLEACGGAFVTWDLIS